MFVCRSGLPVDSSEDTDGDESDTVGLITKYNKQVKCFKVWNSKIVFIVFTIFEIFDLLWKKHQYYLKIKSGRKVEYWQNNNVGWNNLKQTILL